LTVSNLKVATASQMADLARKGHEAGFNRKLDLSHLELDPDGINVLKLVLFDHQAFNRGLPVHHRAQVLLKVTGTMEPAEAWADVAADDWDLLADVPAREAAR
jgi:hypothetical protein